VLAIAGWSRARLTRVMALQGDAAADRFVDGLRFEGLTFSHNESPLPKEGYGGSQAQPDLPAAIEAVGARRCVFSRCTIAQTGNYGLGLGLGCVDNQIVGCRLFDLGGGGIKIGDITMPNQAQPPCTDRQRGGELRLVRRRAMYYRPTHLGRLVRNTGSATTRSGTSLFGHRRGLVLERPAHSCGA